MPKKKREIKAKAVMRIFWNHTRQHPWLFGLSLLGITLNQLSNILGPVYLRDLFNLLATLDRSSTTIHALVTILIIYTIISLIGWWGGRMEMWLGYTLISKVTAKLTKEAFGNLMHHSYQFFANNFSGALTRRVGRFAGAYENLYYSGVTTILEGVLYLVGAGVVLALHNWILGVLVVGWVVIFVALQWFLTKVQHPYRIARASADTDVTASLADAVTNQNTVALFSANKHEEKLVADAADNYQRAQLKSWNLNSIIYGFQGLLTNALNIGMLAVGVWLWVKGTITLGDVVLIQAYVFGIFGTVWSFGRQFNTIYNSLADASEMVETMETPYEVADKKGAQGLKVSAGEIWFDDVSFYFNEKKDVLKNYNLKIAGGEKVALVGPSGAGKTTVTKLLLRLYDVKKGNIQIDGQKTDAVTQDSLRDAIGFVPQEPILFHRTLMENIRYGRRDATDTEVIEAAKKAHCHEFISAFPDQYNTFVGERGVKLSGGERQRVAIARAILKNAPILVLDEATSSLDSESEALIQDALSTLMQGKTVVVIAHRLSTIMKMDRIVVMEEGAIVATGSHLELVNQPGLYQKLWSIQAGGFLGDGDQDDTGSSMNEEKIDELAAAEDKE